MASVTVVIPAYNSAEFLEEAVMSALGQSDPPERVIVVDDESPDNSCAIAARIAAEQPSVQAVQRPNGGAAAARNTGLAMADTEFVQFLDADDRLQPDAFGLHLAEFERHPEAVMVFGANYTIGIRGERLGENALPNEKIGLAEIAMYATPCPSQCLYRRKALLAVGGLNESLRPGDEIDLNMRLLAQGEIWSHPAFVMDYRRHPGQGTRNVQKNSRAHLEAIRLNIGPQGATPDLTLYRRARRKWLARYGYKQHMAALGAIRHGRFSEVLPAAQLALAGLWARAMGAEWSPKG